MNVDANLSVVSPPMPEPETFTEAAAAVARLRELYDTAVRFLCDKFEESMAHGKPASRYRAFYPEVRFETTSFAAYSGKSGES